MNRPVLQLDVPAIKAATRWHRTGLLLLVAALFGTGIWMQSRVYLNHDVAWITHGARWLLQGRRFGSDIVDPNPPLIWWFSLPAAALTRAGLLSEPTALRCWVWLVCAAALLLADRLLAPLRAGGRALEAAAIIAAAAFALTVLAAAAFAQRDYLAFALGLPYCLLLARRLEPGADCPRSLAALSGALAVFGFGFKPWFLAVPVLLEVLRMLEQRTLRGLLRPETLVLGCGLVGYVAAAGVFAPDYFKVALPLARASYWAYDQWQSPWLYGRAALEPALYGAVLAAFSLSLPRHGRALLAATAGFALSHWGQHKGFAYHAYPATATATVVFCHSAAHAAYRLRTHARAARAALIVTLLACLAAFTLQRCWMWTQPARSWLAAYDVDDGGAGQLRGELVATVDRYAPRGSYVYAFSTHPFPAFPTLSYTQAEWGSAFPCQFTVPAFARSPQPAGVDREAVAAAMQVQRGYVLEEFRRYRPQVVLVETAQFGRLGLHRLFDDVAFYRQDPRFAALWQDYRATARVGTIQVYVRNPGQAE